MDVKIILTNHSQQKLTNIFHEVFQSMQNHHLKSEKISVMYTVENHMKMQNSLKFVEKKMEINI